MKVLRFLGIVVVVLAVVLLAGCKDGGTTPLSVLGTWVSTADKDFTYDTDEMSFKSGSSITLGTGTFIFDAMVTIVDGPVDQVLNYSGTISPDNPDSSTTLYGTIVIVIQDDLDFASDGDVFDFRVKNLTSTTCDIDVDLDEDATYDIIDWALTKQ